MKNTKILEATSIDYLVTEFPNEVFYTFFIEDEESQDQTEVTFSGQEIERACNALNCFLPDFLANPARCVGVLEWLLNKEAQKPITFIEHLKVIGKKYFNN